MNASVQEQRTETIFSNGAVSCPGKGFIKTLQVFCPWAESDDEFHRGLIFTCGWDGKSYMSPLSTCRVTQAEGLFCLGLSVTKN